MYYYSSTVNNIYCLSFNDFTHTDLTNLLLTIQWFEIGLKIEYVVCQTNTILCPS